MFFSVKEFTNYLNNHSDGSWARRYTFGTSLPVTERQVARVLREVKKHIANRDREAYVNGHRMAFYKWYRPWLVVDSLARWAPPEGDYGVGVEVERGFTSLAASRFVANAIKDWKYVAIDFEGGTHPIEATFAPFVYSKMSNKKQAFRYLKLLEDNSHLVANHSGMVGCHINVSKGGPNNTCLRVNSDRTEALSSTLRRLSNEQKHRYFGRIPYGYAYSQGRYVEYKLFDSTTDRKTLRRNIHIAVALTELLHSERRLTADTVLEALETGYNKR